MESETEEQRGGERKQSRVWAAVNDDHHLTDDANKTISVETFASQHGHYLVGKKIFSLFIKSRIPSEEVLNP